MCKRWIPVLLLGWAEAISAQQANRFGWNVLKELADTPSSHVMVSPWSIHNALLMAGAGTAGPTRTAFEKAGGIRPGTLDSTVKAFPALNRQLTSQVKHIQFISANAAFVNRSFPLSDAYQSTITGSLNGRAISLDYSDPMAARTINGWVNEQTRNLIPSIIEKTEPGQSAHLINAVYFKGGWARAFDKSDTREGEFRTADGRTVQADMMTMRNSFASGEIQGAEWVMLPFQDRSFSVVLVLPGGSPARWIRKQQADELERAFARPVYNRIQLSVPKIRIEQLLALRPVLEKTGLKPLFEPSADFSRMVEGGGFAVSEVLHKTVFRMDEGGAEAAAVTAVVMEVTAMPQEPEYRTLRFDRPYLIILRESTTGIWLFAGVVQDAGALRIR